MKPAFWLLAVGILGGLTWAGSGCASSGGPDVTVSANPSSLDAGPPFGSPTDVEYAKALWAEAMGDYKRWDTYPGLGGWQPGKSPHGKVLKYYINSATARNPAHPGNGSIIAKENYGMQDGPVMAVTVMQKVKGYDPENGDWFWVKFDPNGAVMSNPKGMKLAGRVAKGMEAGCIRCHSRADGDDFMFINDD